MSYEKVLSFTFNETGTAWDRSVVTLDVRHPVNFPHCLLTPLVQTAPSQVSGVMKERVLQRSVELSWQEPEHPNGVITEYEIKYYEKVSGRELRCERHLMPSLALPATAGHFTTMWGHSRIHVYYWLCLIPTSTTSASRWQSRSLYSSFLCHTSESIGSIFFSVF